MSFAIALSRCIVGGDALPVSVEVHISNGLPAFTIVGLPETAVRESRDRVRSALLNSGFEFPHRRLTVNLAPGDIPKAGTRFDLAIAAAILCASGQCRLDELATTEFVAELALDGRLRPARASVAAALAAAADEHQLVVAIADGDTAALIEPAYIIAADTLSAVAAHLNGADVLPRHRPSLPTAAVGAPDLGDVIGQPQAKRALEVAACGGHNLLLLGPPGTGKSMLAERLPGILPPLTAEEAMVTAAIHSIAGHVREPAAWRQRPFRNPHHGCSAAALVGGGNVPRPGEITLAHHGVLFLDELPEFDRRALECLREPLELGRVSIARAAGHVCFPASFQLIAAMNPCPCGYAGDLKRQCHCTPERIQRYRARVSGPLLERIDIHLEMPRPMLNYDKVNSGNEEPSATVAARVVGVQAIQRDRQGCLNAALAGATMKRHCRVAPSGQQLLDSAAARFALSPRGYHKVWKLARTLADIDGAAMIADVHIAEAVTLRHLDRSQKS